METKDWIILGLAFIPLILVYLHSYNHEVFYSLYNYSGIRAVVEKIHPPEEAFEKGYRKPSSFILWAIGIYVALFSIASARYDRAINSYEMKIAAWQTQMATKYRAEACAQIKTIQKILIPVQPRFFTPTSLLYSFTTEKKYTEGIETLTSTLESYKKDLRNAQLNNSTLQGINLDDANLSGANLSATDLRRANLRRANLSNVNLRWSTLYEAKLSNANLNNSYVRDVDLRFTNLDKAQIQKSDFSWSLLNGSSLREADFKNTLLIFTDFNGAGLYKADFRNCTLDTTIFTGSNIIDTDVDYIKFIASTILYKTKLPKQIENKLKKTHPDLFEYQKWYFEN